MDIELKVLFGSLAAFIAVINYLPYLVGVTKQTLHPHAFSWIIFTIITATVSVAQFTAGAGPGAWAAGATSLTTFFIALFAIKNGGYRITNSDKLTLTGALCAIPAWIITTNPLTAVILLTLIEILGFVPTYRKAWLQPYEESGLAFSLTILKYVLALAAMQHYTLTTTLFPAALILLSTLLLIELTWRKRVVTK